MLNVKENMRDLSEHIPECVQCERFVTDICVHTHCIVNLHNELNKDIHIDIIDAELHRFIASRCKNYVYFHDQSITYYAIKEFWTVKAWVKNKTTD